MKEKVYGFKIREVLEVQYAVKAESLEAAQKLIEEAYCEKGEIFLDYDDYNGESEIVPLVGSNPDGTLTSDDMRYFYGYNV